jgi:hypothetical protein
MGRDVEAHQKRTEAWDTTCAVDSGHHNVTILDCWTWNLMQTSDYKLGFPLKPEATKYELQ